MEDWNVFVLFIKWVHSHPFPTVKRTSKLNLWFSTMLNNVKRILKK